MAIAQLHFYWVAFFLGMLFIMFAFNLMKYQIARDSIYIHYAIYIFLMFAYMLLGETGFYFLSVRWYIVVIIFPPMLSYIFYINFGVKFMDMEKIAPRIARVFLGMRKYIIFYLMIEAILRITEYDRNIELILHDIVRAILIIVSLTCIVLLMLKKVPIVKFFSTGSFLMVFGALLSMIVSIYKKDEMHRQNLWEYGFFFMQLGLLGEILCFSIGLSYKDKIIENERNETNVLLLQQMEENQKIQHEMQDKLKAQVKIIEQELLKKNEELIRQEDIRLQLEYDDKLNKLKQKAWRAQMNPHFIYNSIVTMEAFNIEDRKTDFAKFSQKFAKLTRAILENSQYDFITIKKDLDALNHYLYIETIRTDNKFSYEIICDDTLKNNYLIPPLLIQPFVENAILHGIRHKTGTDGLISIHIYEGKEELIVKIEDNGIGIKKSKLLNAASFIRKEKESLGQTFTEERIHSLNEKGIKKYFTEITDLETMDTEGTKIILYLPLILNE
jgi:sensor histidine kinase YesM